MDDSQSKNPHSTNEAEQDSDKNLFDLLMPHVDKEELKTNRAYWFACQREFMRARDHYMVGFEEGFKKSFKERFKDDYGKAIQEYF